MNEWKELEPDFEDYKFDWSNERVTPSGLSLDEEFFNIPENEKKVFTHRYSLEYTEE